MYSVNPTWRGPPVFSLIWHCCSSHVIQHCLSNRIPRRDIVFGILTRGFILLITVEQWKNLLTRMPPSQKAPLSNHSGSWWCQKQSKCRWKYHHARKHWLPMIRKFSGQCYHFDRICWLEQQSNCTIISNKSIILYGMSVVHAIKTRKKLWV